MFIGSSLLCPIEIYVYYLLILFISVLFPVSVFLGVSLVYIWCISVLFPVSLHSLGTFAKFLVFFGAYPHSHHGGQHLGGPKVKLGHTASI